MAITTYSIDELLQLEPPSWLIEDTIPEGELATIYGAPGDGKSFLALDMALCVAAGIPWQGHVTQKAYVVYVSAEGGRGISKRVAAWLAYHHVKPEDHSDVLAHFITSAIRIHPESGDLDEVLSITIQHPDFLEQLAEVLDPDEAGPLLFIIIDTLARCFEGDENQQEDMGAFIRQLDDLRERYPATILVVHHSRKSDANERGSNSFRGACSTMMFVEKNDSNITLKCAKQKDYDAFTDREFELVVLSQQNSCVIGTSGSLETAKNAELLNDIREILVSQPNMPIREIANALGHSKSTIHRMILKIRADGYI